MTYNVFSGTLNPTQSIILAMTLSCGRFGYFQNYLTVLLLFTYDLCVYVLGLDY